VIFYVFYSGLKAQPLTQSALEQPDPAFDRYLRRVRLKQ